MSTPGYLTVPETGNNDVEHRRQIAQGVNRALAGKLNAVRQITLTPSSTTTIVEDARITPSSFISLQPTTLNAAQMSYWYTSSQTNGSVTFTHPSDAFADKTFNMVVIG